jgi:hypothetical protein
MIIQSSGLAELKPMIFNTYQLESIDQTLKQYSENFSDYIDNCLLDKIKTKYLTNPDIVKSDVTVIPYKYADQYNKLQALISCTGIIKEIITDLALSIISKNNNIDVQNAMDSAISQYFSKYDGITNNGSTDTSITIDPVNSELIAKYFHETAKELNLTIDAHFLQCNHTKFYSKLHILGLYAIHTTY